MADRDTRKEIAAKGMGTSPGEEPAGPSHHIQDEILTDYAAGTSSESEAVFVASHLALCPQCRRRIEEIEEIGGALLESAAPAECGDDAFDALMARIDAGAAGPDDGPDDGEEDAPATAAPARPRGTDDDLTARTIPRPLRDYLDTPISALPWKPVMRGLDEVSVPIGDGGTNRKARLLRIRAGTQMPKHTHTGSEMTIVLSGSFSDERGAFERGDVAIHDDDVDHQPIADEEEDCLCFVVTDAPLRLTGRFTRFLNPFVKF